MAGNQSNARERAYRDYKDARRVNASRETLDLLWAAYRAALSKDTGATQAPKLH